jgi:endonuclease VIII
MPEGDTVRRSARTLEQALTGRRLERAELRWPSAVGVDLVGRTVLRTFSYGKHLLTRFDDGRTLHTHLRMEGSWAIARTGSPGARGRGPYLRAVLGNAVWTALGDRLGMLDVVETRDEHTLLGHLGPDILDDAFPTDGLPETLRRMAARGSTPIAEVLLDQTVVAGIGTIWTAEPLFLRRIWPWTPTDRLEDPEGLLLATRTLMLRSVASTTGFTVTGEGGRGLTSYVHSRMGRPCRRCGTPIERGQAFEPPMDRPISYCPRCQAPSGGLPPGGAEDAAHPAP